MKQFRKLFGSLSMRHLREARSQRLLFNEIRSSVLEMGNDSHTSVNAMMAEMVPNGGLTSQIQRGGVHPGVWDGFRKLQGTG